MLIAAGPVISSTCPPVPAGEAAVRAATAEAATSAASIQAQAPSPQYHFPGLVPGDRWCVTAMNWARAYAAGVAAPVVLASTHEAVLKIVPLGVLREHSVDVPPDPGSL